jgi:SsrA-binding protein
MSLVRSKKANFNYEILDKYEAGIELFGFEVKSLRLKRGSLEGSFVTIQNGEAFLMSAQIPPYQSNNTPKDYNERRPRKLLLRKKELGELVGKSETKGLTLIPISWYNKGTKIKVEIAVARGKKKHDKRADIKKRETDREIRRTLKNS